MEVCWPLGSVCVTPTFSTVPLVCSFFFFFFSFPLPPSYSFLLFLLPLSTAASAPIWQFQGQIERNGEQFSEIATRDYLLSGPECPAGIRAGFSEILVQADRGQVGLDLLTEKFMLCSPLGADQIDDLVNFLENGYVYMAMTDYPSGLCFFVLFCF